MTQLLCKRLGLGDDNFNSSAIYHIPYVRTTQTAKLAHAELARVLADKKLELPVLQASDVLIGSHSSGEVTEWLSQFHLPLIILVSHQPLVSNLVDWLVEGGSTASQGFSSQYSMAPASVAVLEGDLLERGLCELKFMLHA